MTLPDLFRAEEEDEAEEFLEELALAAAEAATNKVVAARELEGSLLQADILKKNEEIRAQVSLVPYTGTLSCFNI